jgi:hypothetical protein
MIFNRTEVYDNKCCLKMAHREVHAVKPVDLQYLRW